MHVDHCLCNRKPESETTKALSAANLFESIKDPGQRIWLDPNSGIYDLHTKSIIPVIGGGELESATRRREFHGVLNQVPEDLLQPCRICPETGFGRTKLQVDLQLLF